jgi:hypothetical protein
MYEVVNPEIPGIPKSRDFGIEKKSGIPGLPSLIGSLRAQPSVGSRAKDPGQEIRGLRPPEANDILYNKTYVFKPDFNVSKY